MKEFPRLHHRLDAALRGELRLRAAQHRRKQRGLAQQYRALYEQWQQRCAGAARSPTCMSQTSPLLRAELRPGLVCSDIAS